MESNDSYYDSDSTIFSPDGRLFQVEYARETVKKGATTLGIKFKNGVLLVAYKKASSLVIEKSMTDKISQIDDNICCAFTGLSADARHLIEYAQDEIQIDKITYSEQMSIKTLVDNICKYKHLFTIFGGVRPFGVILFIAGIDSKGTHLFATDPSGAFIDYKAICEGEKSDQISKFLKNNYSENMKYDMALSLAFKAIQKTTKEKLKIDNFEIAIVEKNKGFYRPFKKETKNILQKI